MDYIVYQAINLINGKRYVGMTGGPLPRRISQHKYGSTISAPKMVFHRAISKHGFDIFKWTIIEENLTLSGAQELEMRLIKDWDLQVLGYNVADGGMGIYPDNHKVDKEFREDYRRYLLSQKTVDYFARNPEKRVEISRKLGGRPINVYKDKEYLQTFETQHECARILGLHVGNINHALRGKIHSTGGFTFEYTTTREC